MDSNFCIENEVAFTRQMYSVNQAMITNILVKKIGAEMTKQDLKKYFEHFGKVVALTFNDNDLCGFRSANVIFKDPKAAAKALTYKDHKQFTATANDIWLQPLLDDTPEQDFSTQSTFLIDLDDHTLLEIFSYLNLSDQLALALSHARFLNVFKIFAQLKHKEVTTNTQLRPLSAYQIQQYFIIAGNFIEMFGLIHCHINLHLRLYTELLKKYCPNLKVLLVSCDLTTSYAVHFNQVLYSNPQLKALFLRECIIKDECSEAISSLPRLELLSIDCCNHITGRHLLLPSLKELHIINCANFKGVDSNMSALSTFSFVSEYFFPQFLKNLPQLCKNLEDLNISCSDGIHQALIELKKLSSFKVLNIYSDNVLELLIQHKADQIQALGIDCLSITEEKWHLITKFKNLSSLRLFHAHDSILKTFYSMNSLLKIELSGKKYDEFSYKDEDEMFITNDGVLELVKNCNSLKSIYLEHTMINHKFTEDLLPVLIETKRPNGQLTFFVHGTLINEKYLSKEYFSEETKPLVKFLFKEKKTPFDGKYSEYFEHKFFSIELPTF